MMLQASGSHVINSSDNNSHSVIHSAIKYLVQNTVSLSKVCTVFLHTLQIHPVGNKRPEFRTNSDNSVIPKPPTMLQSTYKSRSRSLN